MSGLGSRQRMAARLPYDRCPTMMHANGRRGSPARALIGIAVCTRPNALIRGARQRRDVRRHQPSFSRGPRLHAPLSEIENGETAWSGERRQTAIDHESASRVACEREDRAQAIPQGALFSSAALCECRTPGCVQQQQRWSDVHEHLHPGGEQHAVDVQPQDEHAHREKARGALRAAHEERMTARRTQYRENRNHARPRLCRLIPVMAASERLRCRPGTYRQGMEPPYENMADLPNDPDGCEVSATHTPAGSTRLGCGVGSDEGRLRRRSGTTRATHAGSSAGFKTAPENAQRKPLYATMPQLTAVAADKSRSSDVGCWPLSLAAAGASGRGCVVVGVLAAVVLR